MTMTYPLSMATHDPQNAAEWREHLVGHGYVIVHNVVPGEHLQAVIDDIWQHTGANPNDPETWYRREVIRPVGMVEMYHYQSMWNNRQHPHVHDIFRAIHGTDELAVSIDRVGLKPPDNPKHPDYDHKGMIHWDTDMTKYPDIPFHVQGVLALTDTEPDMGGFQCIPETYQHLDDFLKTQTPEKIASRNPDYTGYSITRPRLTAGDLLIWTSLLLHGNGHNTSNKVRLCQYITMNPAAELTAESRQASIESWRNNTHPPAKAFPGDPRRIEEQRSEPAQLTDLGRKLLALDSWA